MKSIVLAFAVLLLAACDAAPGTAARLLARQQAIDPPQLWRIEALSAGDKVVGESWVCADTTLRQTFARVHAEVDGTPCLTTSGPVVREGLSTLRCATQGRSYAISSQAIGDPARDFRLAVTVTPLSRDLGPGRQIRRFRRLGPCPSGWQIGDQADVRP